MLANDLCLLLHQPYPHHQLMLLLLQLQLLILKDQELLALQPKDRQATHAQTHSNSINHRKQQLLYKNY